MPVFWVSEPRLNVRIEDEPLGYSPAVGKRVSFSLSYRQRGGVDLGPAVFGVGTNWSCSFRACVVDLGRGNIRAHRGGAGFLDYSIGTPQFYDGSMATNVSNGYQIEYMDGSKDVFTNVYTDNFNVHYYFLTSQQDPSGNATIYTYANSSNYVKLLSVQDPSGKTNLLFYEDTTWTNQITKVEDPFNRTTTLQYNTNGILANITDVVGVSTSFTYDPSNGRNWVTNMTTPYGPTSFRIGGLDADATEYSATTNQVNRFVEVTLPNGGKELYLFRLDCSSLLSQTNSPFPNTTPLANTLDNVDQQNRNSFHWGPLQYTSLSSSYRSSGNVSNLNSADYALGRLRHWLAYPGTGTLLPSDALSLEQAPSPDGTTPGLFTWYDYDNKSGGVANYVGTGSRPSFVAIVLPDGATRFTHNTYGAHGELTQETSTYTAPDGSAGLRTSTFVYAGNNIDLLQAIGPQSEQVISNYFNSAPHLPDASYDALNQETHYTYNTNFQITSVIRPTGLTTTNIYFTSGLDVGRLDTTIDLEISRTNSFTYSNGLVYTHIDERGLKTTNFWDNLQRLTGVLYPDGTTISNFYTNLDLIVPPTKSA